MRIPGTLPNADEIFTIHEERDSGLTPSQIGARHEISGVVVQSFLRVRANTTLPTPFELKKNPERRTMAIPFYWLGFITAAGRAYTRTAAHPIVLSLDAGDLEHVRTLVADLLRTHPTYEFCYSSRDGHQAYIRERDLGEAVTHWGVVTDPREAALPVEYVPTAALPHFVRGLIEGQIHHPPFGARKRTGSHPSPRARRVTIPGSPRFVEMLRRKLRDASAAMHGEVTTTDSATAGLLSFKGSAALALLRYAYRDPVRTSPRADKFTKTFGAAPSALTPIRPA